MFWCPFVLFCDQMYQSNKVYHCLCGQARGEQINRERLHFLSYNDEPLIIYH